MRISYTTITSGKELQAFMDRKFNPRMKSFVANEFARLIDPWVPMREGMLSQGIAISLDQENAYIYYNAPYAHYMYEGQVYGPSFPIIQDGIVVGWRSPKGKKKHPTGKQIKYSKEMHPLATAHWDKVAMQTQLPVFKQEINKILEEDRDGR